AALYEGKFGKSSADPLTVALPGSCEYWVGGSSRLIPGSLDEGATIVSCKFDDGGAAAAVNGVPSSRQYVSESSSKLRLQVGQLFMVHHSRIRDQRHHIDNQEDCVNHHRHTSGDYAHPRRLLSDNPVRRLSDLRKCDS